MATTEGKVELGLNGQATARMLAVAFFVGGAVATALFAALHNAFHIGPPYPQQISMDGPYWDLFLRSGLGLSVLSFIVVKLRQPRGARIEWNAWGITEWDGDSVRCAIERSKLRVGTLITQMRAKNLPGAAAKAILQRNSLDGAVGGALTLGDEEGRRIYVGEGTQLAWLNDRLSSVSDLGELRQALADLPGMEPELGRSAENKLVGVWLLGIITYLTALLAGMAVTFDKNNDTPHLIILLAVTALFGALRALMPRLRARRLERATRHLGEPVTLLENEESLLVVRTADGQTRKLDPRGWRHPDGGLTMRRGEAWATAAYDYVETAATRKARQSRVLALRLEAWGRLLIPLSALVLLGVALRSFETWKPVIASTAVVVQSTFLGSNLVRTSPAGVELVYEKGKNSLPLKGAAEIFAAGPDHTLAFQTGGVLKLHSVPYSGEGWEVHAKKGEAIIALPRARFFAANKDKDMALIVTDSGEGQLWKTRSIDIFFAGKTSHPLTGATAAAWNDDTLFVGMADGSVEMFSLTGDSLAVLPGKNSPVRGLAVQWATLAVADSAGVSFWDIREKRRRAELAQSGITTIDFGYYPDWLHASQQALLVLTAEGIMSAVDTSGVVKRRFKLHLPNGEQPAQVYSDQREVLVGTDHGGVYELWIH